MAFVIDASVAAAWVLPGEEATLADIALDRLADETAKVTSLLWHEFAMHDAILALPRSESGG